MYEGIKKHSTGWGKLKRVLQYLRKPLDMPIILDADNMVNLVVYMDAGHAVHDDIRSRTGGAMPFGTDIIMCKSTKQMMNTNILTESEVVGASDYMPDFVCVEIFLKHQGIIFKTIEFFPRQSECYETREKLLGIVWFRFQTN